MSDNKNTGGARINRYEQEVNRADMDAAAELATALDVPLAYLFTETDEQAELLLTFNELSQTERTQLLALARKLAKQSK